MPKAGILTMSVILTSGSLLFRCPGTLLATSQVFQERDFISELFGVPRFPVLSELLKFFSAAKFVRNVELVACAIIL